MVSDGTQERQLEKLRRDLGEVFLAALADPATVEILLNADGNLWQERLGEPLRPIGTMIASRAEAVLRTIAACLQTTITRDKPTIEGELPLDGSRFAGQIPPVVTAPVFAVRKRASRVFTLQQYVDAGIMTPEQKDNLCQAIRAHRNILVIGGTGGGKTTLTNGLIHEVTEQFPDERIVIIEDTGEIQCSAKNYLQYHTSPEVNMTKLVRLTLRMRPDRTSVLIFADVLVTPASRRCSINTQTARFPSSKRCSAMTLLPGSCRLAPSVRSNFPHSFSNHWSICGRDAVSQSMDELDAKTNSKRRCRRLPR